MDDRVFTRGDTPIHLLDPRVKIIYCLLFSIVVAVCDKPMVGLAGFLLSLILIAVSRLKVVEVGKRLLLVNAFVFFLWAVLPFTMPGTAAFSIGPLDASQEGLVSALLITIKCNAIVLAGIALLSTCSIFQLVHALRHLGVPDKICHLLFLIYRYGFLINLEYERIHHALVIRGFRPRTSWHTYRAYSYIIGTLLIRSFDRSEQVHKAMVCRGFKGKYWILNHFHLGRRDLLIASIMTLGILGLGLMQWTKIAF